MSDRPKWKEDFPIARGADEYVTRREFTRFLVLVSGATFIGNGYFVLRSRSEAADKLPSVLVADERDIPAGGVKLFRYPTENDPAILVRLTDGTLAAYKQRCTHLSCPVHFAAARGRLECPCHNGAFDAATGAVLQGPPPRPLPRIKLRVADGRIYAEGMEEA